MHASRLNKIVPVVKGVVDHVVLNDWYTDNEVVLTTSTFKLRKFSKGDDKSTPVLILPPQAGHTSVIADYDGGQSVVQAAVDNQQGAVYCIEWLSCTFDDADQTYGDMVRNVALCIGKMSGFAHLVGLCQGGTLATVIAATYPGNVASLTVAGAPIDVQDDGVLQEAISKPLWMYKLTVAMAGGLMTGKTMLSCWMSSDPYQHYIKRHMTPMTYRKARFEAWYYEHTSNLAGTWYLDLIENLFQGNKLIKNEFIVNDTCVDLSRIYCPLNLVTGGKDEISPPNHTNELGNKVSSSNIQYYSKDNVGHIGVFMGTKMINDVWVPLFKTMG